MGGQIVWTENTQESRDPFLFPWHQSLTNTPLSPCTRRRGEGKRGKEKAQHFSRQHTSFLLKKNCLPGQKSASNLVLWCESLWTWTSCEYIGRRYINVRGKSLKYIIICIGKCWTVIPHNPCKVLPHEIPALLHNVLLYRELEGLTEEVPGFLCSMIVSVKQGREKHFAEI